MNPGEWEKLNFCVAKDCVWLKNTIVSAAWVVLRGWRGSVVALFSVVHVLYFTTSLYLYWSLLTPSACSQELENDDVSCLFVAVHVPNYPLYAQQQAWSVWYLKVLPESVAKWVTGELATSYLIMKDRSPFWKVFLMPQKEVVKVEASPVHVDLPWAMTGFPRHSYLTKLLRNCVLS